MNYHTPLNYTWANKSSFNSKMVNMGTTHNEKFIVSFNNQTRIFQPTGNFARVKKRDGHVSTVCKCQSHTFFGIDNISLILNNRVPPCRVPHRKCPVWAPCSSLLEVCRLLSHGTLLVMHYCHLATQHAHA